MMNPKINTSSKKAILYRPEVLTAVTRPDIVQRRPRFAVRGQTISKLGHWLSEAT